VFSSIIIYIGYLFYAEEGFNMKIEKLNEDKIRIILNLEDLKEKNIDFHSFMSNSIESQELFLDMLDEAEKKLGFITKDCKILLEALATSCGTFILTVTRIVPDSNKDLVKKKRICIKRKQNDVKLSDVIYCFNCFEDFCQFCEFLKNTNLVVNKKLGKLFKKVCLYTYNSKYFLVCNGAYSNTNIIKSFYSAISEFATCVNGSEMFERKLREYGKIVMKNNAIDVCMDYLK